MSADNAGKIKILVAEDSAADRLILQTMLTRSDHQVVMVEDGRQAIDAFASFQPDLVFLDVMMPNVDGIEAAREIKRLAGEDLIPVIFLTSLADAKSLAMCLDAGGDDFLTKPYNSTVLDAKIRAFARMREMHRTLAINNRHLIQEQNVAKQVFDKIAHAGSLKLPVIRYYMSALAVFNGDVLLADLSPRGNLFMILGDFTGHGLPAAIGSMPLASTFYGMVGKGFTMPDILREINQKLHQTLPVGLFCCATFVDINFRARRLRVWNGGLPDNILYRKASCTYERIKSRHLPLGILSNRDFKVEAEVFDLNEGDRLLMWSDGIQEARDRAGNFFGEEGLCRILDAKLPAEALYEGILKKVQAHLCSTEKDDDISLVDVVMPSEDVVEKIITKSARGHGFLENWCMSFRLDASSLRVFNPLSMLISVLSEVPGLRQSSSVLYTLMSELYNNALEHGVLQLSSEIKSSPAGFAEYYRLRKEKLAEVVEAFVEFEFEHRTTETGGLLTIAVKDSGQGYAQRQIPALGSTDQPLTHLFGRGLSLVASIAESVEVIPPGNHVKVRFRWSFED